MAFLFSPEKVLSLEINNFHNNNKGVQAPMLPSAIWGGRRGRTHGQKYHAKEDRLRGRAFLAGRQPASLGVSLGSGKVVYTGENQHRRPRPKARGCFTAAKI